MRLQKPKHARRQAFFSIEKSIYATCVVVSYLDTYGEAEAAEAGSEVVALASESKEVALSKAQLCEILKKNVRLNSLRPLRPALLGPDYKGCRGSLPQSFLPKMFDYVHEYYFLYYHYHF